MLSKLRHVLDKTLTPAYYAIFESRYVMLLLFGLKTLIHLKDFTYTFFYKNIEIEENLAMFLRSS